MDRSENPKVERNLTYEYYTEHFPCLTITSQKLEELKTSIHIINRGATRN